MAKFQPRTSESIQITGVDELIKKLGKVEGPKVLMEPMEWSVSEVEDRISTYPPTIPGSLYRRGQDPRSEDLGGRFSNRVYKSMRGVTGKVTNNARSVASTT